jgi:hypothetical protein
MAKKKSKKVNSKKVNKYDVGGDVRRGAQASPMFDVTFPRPSPPPGSVTPGSSATGEVGRIKKSADRAGRYLSEAEQAIGSERGGGFFGGIGNVIGGLGGAVGGGMKKGGKVKKKKAKKPYNTGGKVRGVGRAVNKKVRPCKMVKMKGS